MALAPGLHFPRVTVAASLLVALVAAGCAPAESSASPTQTESQTFVSERYNFSIALPAGTTLEQATVDWDGSCLCGLEDPAWDVAFVYGRTLAIGATAVDPTIDLERWQAMMVELAPAICTDSERATQATLGGDDALTWTASCSDGYSTIKLAALHGGRGYMVLFASLTRLDPADSQSAFDALIGSFRYVES